MLYIKKQNKSVLTVSLSTQNETGHMVRQTCFSISFTSGFQSVRRASPEGQFQRRISEWK